MSCVKFFKDLSDGALRGNRRHSLLIKRLVRVVDWCLLGPLHGGKLNPTSADIDRVCCVSIGVGVRIAVK